MQNKKTLILIPVLVAVLAVSGCGKKGAPRAVVNNNNTQRVNQNTNSNSSANTNTPPPTDEPKLTENGIEFNTWPDASFKEEDYKGWKTYTNTKLGYSIKYPADWEINACDEGCSSKEVIINPPDAESFVSYISISIDSRKLESIRKMNTEIVNDGKETQIIFAGQLAYQFTSYVINNKLIIIPYKNKIYRVSTDKDNDLKTQQALASFKFID